MLASRELIRLCCQALFVAGMPGVIAIPDEVVGEILRVLVVLELIIRERAIKSQLAGSRNRRHGAYRRLGANGQAHRSHITCDIPRFADEGALGSTVAIFNDQRADD